MPRPRPHRFRSISWGWLDWVLLAALVGSAGLIMWRASTVFQYRWDWSTIWPFIFRLDPATGRWVPNIIVDGFLTTIRLAVWGILIAGVLGTLMALARNSRRLFLRLLSGSYVMLIRNIPPVVFVFVFVFFIASQVMPKLRWPTASPNCRQPASGGSACSLARPS
jgi:polar amino acid transport system permease protein